MAGQKSIDPSCGPSSPTAGARAPRRRLAPPHPRPRSGSLACSARPARVPLVGARPRPSACSLTVRPAPRRMTRGQPALARSPLALAPEAGRHGGQGRLRGEAGPGRPLRGGGLNRSLLRTLRDFPTVSRAGARVAAEFGHDGLWRQRPRRAPAAVRLAGLAATGPSGRARRSRARVRRAGRRRRADFSLSRLMDFAFTPSERAGSARSGTSFARRWLRAPALGQGRRVPLGRVALDGRAGTLRPSRSRGVRRPGCRPRHDRAGHRGDRAR